MTSVVFHVWGSRGGRSTGGSRLGSATSCYSLTVGSDLFVFDAGSGLVALSEAIAPGGLLATAGIERVHLLITHAHMDHWEGLKNADWMWRRGNGIALTILAPGEALDIIRRAHEPPAFVPLDILALGTLATLSWVELAAGGSHALGQATLEAVALHHYSGIAPHQRHLHALGYRLRLAGGPTVAYLCDHEPTTETRAMEDAVLAGSQLVIVDANFANLADHAFGHGSIEYAAHAARRHPTTRVVAAHHGPMLSDAAIEDAHRRHGAGCDNLVIAADGHRETWDPGRGRFAP